MYSVVLSTLIGFGANSADCWGRSGQSGYAGRATCAPVMPMPMSCGCSPCPSCGGMPMQAPPMMMGGMATPAPNMMGDLGMALPPNNNGTVLPPNDNIPPLNTPPALNEERASANQAQFVVRLPPDARLVAEGTVIPGAGPIRVFSSPALEPGREYLYDLAIEVDRGGKVLRDQQTVRFQVGKTVNVTFVEPRPDSAAPPLAPTTSRIRVRLPDGAALYVEGRPWATAVVQTPPLDPMRTHYYQLRVETIRDGRRAVMTREVSFRAGQELTVDFTSDRSIQGNIAKNSR